jgi:hypothetical protein
MIIVFIKSSISGNRTRKSHPKSLMKTGDALEICEAHCMFLDNFLSVSKKHWRETMPIYYIDFFTREAFLPTSE